MRLKNLTYLLFFIFGFGTTVSATPVDLVEINLEVRNYSRNARIFLNHFERPFRIPSGGKTTLYAIKDDTITVEIHSYGFQKVVLKIDSKKIYRRKGSNTLYFTSYVIDFKDAPYYGERVNEKKMTEKEPYPHTYGWVAGNFVDQENGKKVKDAVIGILGSEYYSEYHTKYEIFYEKNGYCIPIFDGSEMVILTEKDGYYTSVTEINDKDYKNRITLAGDQYLIWKNAELVKNDTGKKFVTCITYKWMELNLDFIHFSEVLSTPSMNRFLAGDSCYYQEMITGREKLFIRFIHPQYGINRLYMEQNENYMTMTNNKSGYDTLYVDDLKKPFALVRLIPMIYTMGWNNTRLADVLSGTYHYSGRIVDSVDKLGIENVRITPNDGNASVYTNHNGAFSLERLPYQVDSLYIEKVGHKSLNISTSLLSKSENIIELQAQKPSSTIKGILYSDRPFQPLPNFPVHIRGTYSISVTDENGRYEFSNLSAGDYMISSFGDPPYGYPFSISSDTTIVQDLCYYSTSNSVYLIEDDQIFGKKGDFYGKIIDFENAQQVYDVELRYAPDKSVKADNYKSEFSISEMEDGYHSIDLIGDDYYPRHIDSVYFKSDNLEYFQFQIKKMPPQSIVKRFDFEQLDSKSTPESRFEIVSRKTIDRRSEDNFRLRGRVCDAESGEPIIGANIVLDNTTIGAATGLGGDFVIRKVLDEKRKLVVSAIGYGNLEVDLDLEPNENIELNFYLVYQEQPFSRSSGSKIFTFGGYLGDPPTPVYWFLEGCLMVRIFDEDGDLLINNHPIIKYTNKPDPDEMAKVIQHFGEISIADTINGKGKITLCVSPFNCDKPFIIDHFVQNDASKPLPFFIFDVFFKEGKNKNFKLGHFEVETITYPPSRDQISRYPWMEQQIIY